uniref:THAP-type domain-containing protein n=1 Tax=Poecilia reticulata TaxID=8081 RepID=A0A3P9PZ48_POERE
MGRENWTPSRHQYICHEHFSSSCFKVRWGIRYLDADAVPTVFPDTETADGLMSDAGAAELLMMSDGAAEDGQVELVNGITAAILSQGGVLVLNEAAPDPDLASFAGEDIPQEVVAYFETVPNVLPGGTSTRVTSPPDTVLSPALSSKPISSTLPIVSKHVPTLPPPSLVLTLERLDEPFAQIFSSCVIAVFTSCVSLSSYHKNSLSKEQLEAIVAELQKKVKVLQQRHRRHLEKLLGLENTVSQLRQSNMLNEERLQLLERVLIQTPRSQRMFSEFLFPLSGHSESVLVLGGG